MVRDLLEEAGIPAQLSGSAAAETLNHISMGTGIGNAVLIREVDTDAALEIVREADAAWQRGHAAYLQEVESQLEVDDPEDNEEDPLESDASASALRTAQANRFAYRAGILAYLCAGAITVAGIGGQMLRPDPHSSVNPVGGLLVLGGLLAAIIFFRAFLKRRSQALAHGELGKGGRVVLILAWCLLAAWMAFLLWFVLTRA